MLVLRVRFESTVQITKLQDLVNRSKMARCRGRFVCPVILYNGKVHNFSRTRPLLSTNLIIDSLKIEPVLIDCCQADIFDSGSETNNRQT